jgi:hypothetical protein
MRQRKYYLQILYYDKDSYNIPEGDMLGEWESETSSPIVSVLALAPKSYRYDAFIGSTSNIYAVVTAMRVARSNDAFQNHSCIVSSRTTPPSFECFPSNATKTLITETSHMHGYTGGTMFWP